MKQDRHYDVVGVGAPIIDCLLRVPASFLATVPGPKHGMMWVDYEHFCSLVNRSGQTCQEATGGSCANTLEGLSNLGRRCALHGGIGKDAAAERFLTRLQEQDIDARLVHFNSPTTQVLCLITPDGHRTFRAVPGASAQFSSTDIDRKLFANAKLVHVEGYTTQNGNLLNHIASAAKEEGALVSLDLSSHEIVLTHRTLLLDVLQKYVDIVFCNEDEARALEQTGPERACEQLRKLCSIAVVLRGQQGCLVGSKKGVQSFPAYPVKPIDTTGAGDFFASGFLHGYLEGQSLSTCAHYGAEMGRAVVQVLGAEIPTRYWLSLRKACSVPLPKNTQDSTR